jgi:hypothetical protein
MALACRGERDRARGELDDAYVTRALREWSLLRDHRSAWLRATGMLEAKYTLYGWRRGFVRHVATDTAVALRSRAGLLAQPLEILQLSSLSRADVPKLVVSGLLAAAPRLMLAQLGPSDDALDAASVR